MKFPISIFIVLLFLNVNSQTRSEVQYGFQNTKLSDDERIADLTQRLSIEEKCAFLLNDFEGVEHLGIPSYNWWNEALHGVARAGRATVFPQAIGMAATFDDTLIKEVADIISDEARAKYVDAQKKNNRDRYVGLTFWTPNVNIFRDPRWGRGQETFGEDPLLTSRMGAAFVRGLQGNHPDYLKTSACAKHYVVHSGPEPMRHYFDAKSSEFDLRNTYLPAFKSLVEAGVSGVMCAYNRTNGEPCCGSDYLLNDILTEEFGFDGYIVSDCNAIRDFWRDHKVVSDEKEAAALALTSGVNVNCGQTYNFLMDAYNAKLINEDDIDAALYGTLKILFRLGFFDPMETFYYNRISSDIVNSENHVDKSLEVAQKSLVLLKNEGVLPLKRDKLKNIYVTGPNAASMDVLWANYNGFSENFVTLLEGVMNEANPGTIVNYNEGCGIVNDTIFRRTFYASQAEVVIAGLGLNSLLEGEAGDAYLSEFGGDRKEVKLPENQIKYVKRLRQISKGKIVAVIMGGSAISLTDIEPYVDAIIYAWYPGEQGGAAIADVLFGNYNPSGRLPVTIYKSLNDLPVFTDYSMKNRTYRYFTGKPEYAFGFGLSFSDFKYSDLNFDKSEYCSGNDTISLSFTLSNISDVDGEEVIQIYFSFNGGEEFPIKQLVDFKREYLRRNESKIVNVEIPVSRFEFYLPRKKRYEVSEGEYQIMIGGSSDSLILSKTIEIQ
jgi:beta-glucosidase